MYFVLVYVLCTGLRMYYVLVYVLSLKPMISSEYIK